jgi:Protein of unknown function (DUF3297)
VTKKTKDNMTDTKQTGALPDRLSNDPRSPFYNEKLLEQDVGVRFKGVEKTNVAEYCISEGWIRVEAGKTKDRHGNPLTIKLSGPVEVFFKDPK